MLQNVLRAIEAVILTPKFLLNPSPVSYYEYLGDDVVEGKASRVVDNNKPLWLNLGYWKTARKYPDAAAALAHKLAEAAQLGPTDSLLDVGFGFAEQDFYWVEKFGVGHITGINITPMQVERSVARVKERGLESRIDLRVGSATELPFEPNSFTKITALECAHHFNTRQKFFEEAFRVLKPGGRLATGDGATSDGDGRLTFINKMALKRWFVPLDNMYTRDEYCKRLQGVGFVNVQCETIRNYVFPGCVKYQTLRQKGQSMQDAVVELTQQEIDDCFGLDLWKKIGLTDYVIFSADKPK